MYRLKRKQKARQQLRALREQSPRLGRDAYNIIFDLQHEPRPTDAEEMFDEYQGYHRIRFNNHRIIYKADDDERTVTIWTVKPRDRNTYTTIS